MAIDFKPRSYQQALIDHLDGGAESLLLVEMGLGKTAPVLTYLNKVIREDREKGLIRRFLVVAPLKVVRYVWPAEARKWSHLSDLRVGTVTGAQTPTKRKRAIMDPNLDVVVMNYEQLTWFCNQYPPGQFPFYGLVLDEIDKLKDPGAKRFDAFRYRAHEFEVRIGMTGTITPEALQNIWGPAYMISSFPVEPGKRAKKMPMTAVLGSSYNKFLNTYFQSDFMGYRWDPRPGAMTAIGSKLAPYTFVARAADHLDLPELIVNDIVFELPPKARERYDQLEKDFILELETGAVDIESESEDDTVEVAANSAAVLKNKLRQLCSGFLYSRDDYGVRHTTWLHKAKIGAYRDAVSELMGQSHVAAYGFQAEVSALNFQHRLGSHLSETDEAKVLSQWNAGELSTLAVHPASAGHGLNLHESGCHNMLILTLPWSRGLYDQLIARLLRMGQKHPVIVHRFVAKDTVDEAVVEALNSKGNMQRLIMEALKRRAA